jgi:hypothetical protein
MTAIECACRICAAQPYEVCRNPDRSPCSFTHAARIEDAASISEPPMAVDPALVDEAFQAVADEIA